ncbi:hypothetical protein RF11_10539 [Thelohanellus kitauei]|uniref:Uncharacterized protein n=1 Tax=Thelohanellus kitauei TaxID=669202 RepID=A0A0C2MZJ5_THEKT|nr:hypothetical protein RF11_10539 [Thelohanellus kitauei]
MAWLYDEYGNWRYFKMIPDSPYIDPGNNSAMNVDLFNPNIGNSYPVPHFRSSDHHIPLPTRHCQKCQDGNRINDPTQHPIYAKYACTLPAYVMIPSGQPNLGNQNLPQPGLNHHTSSYPNKILTYKAPEDHRHSWDDKFVNGKTVVNNPAYHCMPPNMSLHTKPEGVSINDTCNNELKIHDLPTPTSHMVTPPSTVPNLQIKDGGLDVRTQLDPGTDASSEFSEIIKKCKLEDTSFSEFLKVSQSVKINNKQAHTSLKMKENISTEQEICKPSENSTISPEEQSMINIKNKQIEGRLQARSGKRLDKSKEIVESSAYSKLKAQQHTDNHITKVDDANDSSITSQGYARQPSEGSTYVNTWFQTIPDDRGYPSISMHAGYEPNDGPRHYYYY